MNEENDGQGNKVKRAECGGAGTKTSANNGLPFLPCNPVLLQMQLQLDSDHRLKKISQVEEKFARDALPAEVN